MTRAKKVRRAKRRPEKVRAPAEPLPDQDANAASGALLALEEGRRAPDVQPAADDSVEDPLQDWPEAEGDPERWLEERSGPDVQKVPDE